MLSFARVPSGFLAMRKVKWSNSKRSFPRGAFRLAVLMQNLSFVSKVIGHFGSL